MLDSATEYRLLGSCIDKPDTLFQLSENLFTDNRAHLFRSMRDAYARYGEVTYEGLERFYQNPIPGELEAARGSRPEPLIDRLQTLYRKRQLIDISNRLNVLISQPDPSIEEIQRILQFEVNVGELDSSVQTGVAEFISDFTRKRNGTYKFVRTGLGFLDYMLGGEWGRKTLSIIIAKPGAGKTSLVGNSMLNMALQGQPSLFISIEMPKDQLISRLVAAIAEIDNRDIRAGSVSNDKIGDLDAALEKLQSLPIYIIHKTNITVGEIIHQIRLHKELYGIDAFFVDYLQIINRDEQDDVRELGKVTQELRNAAEKYDVAGILLAQQNRMGEGQGSIFGSSKVAWIADNIFEITTNGSDEQNDDLRIMEMNAVKNRNGPLGAQAIRYQPRFLRFLD